jgi:dihydrofolate reductase
MRSPTRPSLGWLVDYLGPNPVVDDLVPKVGALLVGRNTYGGDDPYKGTRTEGEAFGGAWHGPQIVLTHRPPAESPRDVTFAGDLPTAIEAAGTAAGDQYVCILGASVAAVSGGRGARRGIDDGCAGATR